MFALGVSLRSSNYLTKGDLKSFSLALVDDEDYVGSPLMVLSLSTIVPPRTVVKVAPSASLAALALLAAARLV